MTNLGPGPRRWKRAQAAFDRATEQRNRDIAEALKERRGTVQEIADAYGLTRAYVYQLGEQEVGK